MVQLKGIRFKPFQDQDEFPFNLPVFRDFPDIVLEKQVTLLVGENGTGKSTFVEALAIATNAITIGSASAERDESLVHVRKLASKMVISWQEKSYRGFFMRAEDFFNYSRSIREEIQRMERERDDLSRKGEGTAGIGFALSAARGRYGANLDSMSHGEAFLDLFKSRIVPNGVYILDEPEAPLSPLSQLALVSLVKEMAGEGCQFIIATHSPILLAIPGAEILSFDEIPIKSVQYEDVEHVRIMRDFLNDPEAYLRRL